MKIETFDVTNRNRKLILGHPVVGLWKSKDVLIKHACIVNEVPLIRLTVIGEGSI